MMALWLGDDHLIFRGEAAVANGWFQRAARILEGLEPCPEHGWLAALQGYMALGKGDTARARELAARGRELGRRLGVVCLEMFGLAVEGVALVNEGQVEEGMRCLDEATAAALGGEYEQIVPAGWTCCLLIGACERARDYDRAAQWCRKVEEFSRRMQINFVTGTCRAHYGAVLTWHGNWSDAERELTEATEDLTANRPSWSGAALVRLADLRRRQGRLGEAEELLSQAQRNALAPLGMAELALDQGDASAARDLLEPLLRRLPVENRTLRAHPVELVVRAQVAAGAVESATAHVSELRAIAAAVGTQPLHAAVSFSEGLSPPLAAITIRRASGSRTRSSCSPQATLHLRWDEPGSSWPPCWSRWTVRTRLRARRQWRSGASTRSGLWRRARGRARCSSASALHRRPGELHTGMRLLTPASSRFYAWSRRA